MSASDERQLVSELVGEHHCCLDQGTGVVFVQLARELRSRSSSPVCCRSEIRRGHWRRLANGLELHLISWQPSVEALGAVAADGVDDVATAIATVVLFVVLVRSMHVSAHMPRCNCDEEVEPCRPAGYGGQSCEEQTRPP